MQQKSWLYSDSFLKRAFAIWGHAAIAHLIIVGVVMVVMIGFAVVLGLAMPVPQSGM